MVILENIDMVIFENIDIDIDIDIDMVIFENIDININKAILGNIDIDKDNPENIVIGIDNAILKNIAIDKNILENIDIDIDIVCSPIHLLSSWCYLLSLLSSFLFLSPFHFFGPLFPLILCRHIFPVLKQTCQNE